MSENKNLPALSANDVSKVIERSAQLHLESVARRQDTYSPEEVIHLANELEIPAEFVRAALREHQSDHPAITFSGDIKEVRDRVVRRLISQSAEGTGLERVSKNEVVLHYPKGAQPNTIAAFADKLTLRFSPSEEDGTTLVSWEVDFKRWKKACHVCDVVGGIGTVIGLLSIAGGVLGAPWLYGLAACMLSIFPFFLIIGPIVRRTSLPNAVKQLENSMTTLRELELLSFDDDDEKVESPKALPASAKADDDKN